MSLSQAAGAKIVWEPHAEQNFVATALRHLRNYDESALAAELQTTWPVERLIAFLESSDDDTVKVAAAALGIVGNLAHCSALAAALHHDDAVVVTMAEHALWQIWFRAAPPDACRSAQQAARLIARGYCDDAIELLGQVVGTAPEFAEAYNQRAMAYYLADRHAKSLADCRRTIRLNPTHFAALAAMGHCFVHLAQYRRALAAYHAALNIHPRMDGIRQSIRQVRLVLGLPAAVATEQTTR